MKTKDFKYILEASSAQPELRIIDVWDFDWRCKAFCNDCKCGSPILLYFCINKDGDEVRVCRQCLLDEIEDAAFEYGWPLEKKLELESLL